MQSHSWANTTKYNFYKGQTQNPHFILRRQYQLFEVKVSFAFGYRIGLAGKYLVPKMQPQLKIINSIMILE
jgi:hypothetical protein